MDYTSTKRRQKFSIRARARSFRYAVEGVTAFFRSEPNAVLHLGATILVTSMAFVFGVTPTEAIALVIVTGFVWAAELFNTSIEKSMDLITDKESPSVKFIKDVAAAGVLVAALTALIVGAIVFIPKIALVW